MKNDVKHAIQLICMNKQTKSRFEVVVTSYGCKKNRDDEIKKIKRRPIIASAIASRLLIKKINQCQNAACEHKTNSDKCILGSNQNTRPRKNYESMGKPFGKTNSIQKIETVNIKVKLPHVNRTNHQRESDFFFKHRFVTLL